MYVTTLLEMNGNGSVFFTLIIKIMKIMAIISNRQGEVSRHLSFNLCLEFVKWNLHFHS